MKSSYFSLQFRRDSEALLAPETISLYLITREDLNLSSKYIDCIEKSFQTFKGYGAYTLGFQISNLLRKKQTSFLRVDNPEKAQLFFIDYDPGYDLKSCHCQIGFQKLSRQLDHFHQTNTWWKKKHFLASSRPADYRSKHCGLNQDKHIIKFVEEKWGRKNPNWEPQIMDLIVGIPKSPLSGDIKEFPPLFRPRKHLITFFGRLKTPSRRIFGKVCQKSSECHLIDTLKYPNRTTEDFNVMARQVFLQSVFCFQHSGDDYTRSSLFESLFAGCIPVIITPFILDVQYPLHIPQPHRISFLFPKPHSEKDILRMFSFLKNLSKERISGMQKDILDLLPRIQWSNPTFLKVLMTSLKP